MDFYCLVCFLVVWCLLILVSLCFQIFAGTPILTRPRIVYFSFFIPGWGLLTFYFLVLSFYKLITLSFISWLHCLWEYYGTLRCYETTVMGRLLWDGLLGPAAIFGLRGNYFRSGVTTSGLWRHPRSLGMFVRPRRRTISPYVTFMVSAVVRQKVSTK